MMHVICFKKNLEKVSFYVASEVYNSLTHDMKELRKNCAEYPGDQLRQIYIEFICKGYHQVY